MKLVSTGLALVGAAVLIGAAAFGISRLSNSAEAQAPQHPFGITQYEEFLAKELGISVERLQEAQKAARQKILDEAVASGKIKPELAEKMKDGGKMFPGFPGGGPRPNFERSEMERKGSETRFSLTDLFTIAAGALGMTEDELKAELEDKSLAEIANEKGVSLDVLKTKVTDALKAQLAKAVTDGYLTQEQAIKITEMFGNVIDKMINGTAGRPGASGFRFEFRDESPRMPPFR